MIMFNRARNGTRAVAMAAALLLTGISLGGCIIVEPRHHYYGYYR